MKECKTDDKAYFFGINCEDELIVVNEDQCISKWDRLDTAYNTPTIVPDYIERGLSDVD